MTRPYLSEWDRNRYSLHFLLARVPEDKVQADLLEALKWRGIVALPVDAGAKDLRGRAQAMARQLGANQDQLRWINGGKSGAGIKGLADVVGVLPGGRALFIECKAPAWFAPSGKTGHLIQDRAPGKPSDAQLAFLDTMHAAGAVVGIVWGPGDLKHILAAAGLDPG